MTPAPPLLVAVALGGSLGAVLRHLLGVAVPDGGGFPWTTFAINVVGSAVLAGLLFPQVVRRSPALTAGLGPGLLGGFTTFSTTSEQGRALLAAGDTALALAYLLGTLAACVGAATLVGLVAPPLPAADER